MTVGRSAATGIMTSTTAGPITTSYGLNKFGEMISFAAANGSTAIFTYQYTRDNLGRITKIAASEAGKATTRQFTYDSIGQLASENNGTTTTSYSYDSNGNRLTSGARIVRYRFYDERAD